MSVIQKGAAAVVTGASSGIGLAIAKALAERGVRVGLLARRAGELEAIAGEIRAAGGAADALAADVTRADNLRGAVDRFVADAGRLDILVASAGLGAATPAWAFDNDLAQRMIDLNVHGVVNAVAVCAPHMVRAGGGHIVGLSSLAGLRGLAGNAVYCATKAAVARLMDSLRIDLAPMKIGVTSVHPGWVRTPMSDGNSAAIPVMLEADDVALATLSGVDAGRSRVFIPRTLAASTMVGNLAPNTLFDVYMGSKTWPFGVDQTRPAPRPAKPGNDPLVAIITGASTGIGLALSKLIGRKRARVVMIARREDLLHNAAAEVEAQGGTVRAHAVDVTDHAAVAEVVRHTREEFGRLDVFIANAGTGDKTPGDAIDPAVAAHILDLNVKAFTANIASALPIFLEQGFGHVVGVGSVAAFRGLPKTGVYCASKAYVRSFMESLRADLKPYGIAATCLSPGFVDTPIHKGKFPKPFIMSADAAAREIWSAVVQHKAHHAFPLPMAALIRTAQIMPDALYDRLVAGKR